MYKAVRGGYNHNMNVTLYDQILQLDYPSISTPDITQAFLTRAEEMNLTRDENPLTHFNVYFLPFNPKTREVFIVHHKKANSWISPGGHTDKGELLKDVVLREINEELGVKANESDIEGPFLLTIKEIDNPLQTCKRHFDIWFLYRTEGSDFKIDPTEFYDTKWVGIDEALQLVTNQDNILAFNKIKLTEAMQPH